MIGIILLHAIGAICSILFYIKTGAFKEAKKHGDDIRFAKPSDIIFQCVIVWEILVLISIVKFIVFSINNIDW